MLIVTRHLMSQAGAEGVRWGRRKQPLHKGFFVCSGSREVGLSSAWKGKGTVRRRIPKACGLTAEPGRRRGRQPGGGGIRLLGFQGGSVIENPPANAGNARDPGSIPRSGRSLSMKRRPAPVFWPGESHGRKSLVGYSPKGRRESDTPERAQTGKRERFPGQSGRRAPHRCKRRHGSFLHSLIHPLVRCCWQSSLRPFQKPEGKEEANSRPGGACRAVFNMEPSVTAHIYIKMQSVLAFV